MNKKNIFTKFPTFEEFWQQAKYTFLTANEQKDKVNARWFSFKVYDYWKLDRYWGEEEQFFSKLYSRLGTDFISLQKKEDLYQALFKNIKLQADKLN